MTETNVEKIPAADNDLPDGVHFGLDEKIYHALPRLSASGITDLLVSPGTFWKNSWLDPDKCDDDTPARILGRAYHTARLEPHKLDAQFVCELDKGDFADGLVTDSAVKAKLKELEQPQSKSGETMLDRCWRLRDAGYTGPIYQIALDEWEEEKGDRTPIPAKYWRDIQVDMDRMRNSPEIAKLFTDGAAEVSLLWTCKQTGIRMKARIDYLKEKLIADLKTFQNTSRKRLDQCVADAFRYNRYYIQAAVYWDAVDLIRTGDLKIIGEATDAERAIIHGIQTNLMPMESWYVFQEKEGVPNLIAYNIGLLNTHASADAAEIGIDDKERLLRVRNALTHPSGILMKARLEIHHAKSLMNTYSSVYEDGETWQTVNPLRRLDDSNFNGYWLEDTIT